MKLQFGDSIRSAMEARKLRASDLASAIGCSRQQVSMWLNNRADPPLYRIVEIADLLECTTDELLGRDSSVPYVARVYNLLNEDGKRSLDAQAHMHLLNPFFQPEGLAGKVQA